MGGLGLGLKDLSGQANEGFRKWILAEAFGAELCVAIGHTPRGFLTSAFKAALTRFTHLQQGGEDDAESCTSIRPNKTPSIGCCL